MQNQNSLEEVNLKNSNNGKSIVTKSCNRITIIISFSSSIIAAMIIGYFTLKASVDAVKLNNKSQQIMLQKTVENKLIIAKKENATKLNIALKNIENNKTLSENAVNSALDLIQRDNALKIKAQIDKENREMESRRKLALNYFLSDISVRILYPEGSLAKTGELLSGIFDSPETKIFNLQTVLNLEAKLISFSNNSVFWTAPSKINTYIAPLDPKLQMNILLFYRLVDYYQSLEKSIFDNEIKLLRDNLIKTITSKYLSDKKKQSIFDYYMSLRRAGITGLKYYLAQVVFVGLNSIILLQHKLNINSVAYQNKLAHFQNTMPTYSNESLSSLKDLMNQIIKIQPKVMNKNNNE